jgi:hypothetical protein
LLSLAFWSSLLQEEGRTVTISLMFLPHSDAIKPLILEDSLPAETTTIVRMSPALNYTQRGIGITRLDDGELRVWGTADTSYFTIIVSAIRPGTVTVRYFGRLLMIFSAGNATFLEGEGGHTLLSIMSKAAENITTFKNPYTFSSILLEIIRTMFSQGHGGTILVIPPNDQSWEKMYSSIRFKPSKPYLFLHEIIESLEINKKLPFEMNPGPFSSQIQQFTRDAVEEIGLLSSVDGALLIDYDLNVLGFGVMLHSEPKPESLKAVVLEVGLPSPTGKKIELVSNFGGARHKAAADFCSQVKNSLAIVASQDQKLTMFGWIEDEPNLWAFRKLEVFLS